MEWIIEKKLSFSSMCACMRQIGNDYQITIQGGEKPHIGSVVLAIPRPSLKGDKVSCTSSVLNVVGHKDEAICRELAESIAKEKNAVVVCTGGFHIDDISETQLSEVMNRSKEILQELVSKITC